MTGSTAWASRPLGELTQDGELSYGVVQPGTTTPSGTPIVRVKDLDRGRIDRTSPMRVEPEIASRHQRTQLRGGELLVTIVGTVGESAVVPEDMSGWNVARAIAVIRPTDVSAHWIRYCLESPDVRASFDSMLNTTVQSTLNLADLKRLLIPVPPASVRDAIVDVLRALDDKIAANQALVADAESLAVAFASRTHQSVALSELVSHHKETLTPVSLDEPLVAHYSLPAFDAEHAPEIVSPQSIKSGKFEIRQGSVLVSKLNPRFPRIWDIPAVDTMRGLASTEFLVLESRFTSSTVLWSVLSHPDFSASLESQVAGTSGSHQRVRPADLLATPVGDPRTIGNEASEVITALGRCIAACRAESAGLDTMRASLLPELMSGRLRVKDAERVAAEVV